MELPVLPQMLVPQLPKYWVQLNMSILILAMLLCYVGYGFIFTWIKQESHVEVGKADRCFGISLGISDIMASTITVPIFIAGLSFQEEFLPPWSCKIAGFIDNVYLACSVWNIVMWSVHRVVFMTRPFQIIERVKVARIMIKVVWIGSIIFAMFPIFTETYMFSTNSFTCCSNDLNFCLAFGIFNILIPFLVTLVVFPKIYFTSRSLDVGNRRRFSYKSKHEKKCSSLLASLESCKRCTSPITSSSACEQIVSDISQSSLMRPLKCLRARRYISIPTDSESSPIDNVFMGIGRTETPPSTISPLSATIKCGLTGNLGISQKEVQRFVFHDPTVVVGKRRSFKKSLKGYKKLNKKRSVQGSKRTLLVLSLLFGTQVMCTLPIFIIFIFVYLHDKSIISLSWKPSLEQIVIMTALIVCNTGFNPSIRIAIRPIYNKKFRGCMKLLWRRFTPQKQ